MRPISILIVVVALILAGLVYYAVPQLMNRGEAPASAPAKIAAAEVMVAAKALPAGTILKPDDVRWQAWPEDALAPSFLVKSKGADPQKDAVGHAVLHGFEVGEPITAQRLIRAGQAGFLAAALTPGYFAISVPVSAVTGVAGFVQPGDRVNVLLFEKYAVKDEKPDDAERKAHPNLIHIPPPFDDEEVGELVLANLRLLAIDQVTQDIDGKPKLSTTATLEVNLEQAEKLAVVGGGGMGSLVLALRSLTSLPEPVGPHPDFITDRDISPFRTLRYQQFAATLAKGKSAEEEGPPPKSRPAPEPPEVRVYHGAAAAGGAAK